MASREERAERIKKAQEIRKSLAERDNAKVVFARTRDTSGLILLIQSGDVAINRLRSGLGINYDFETGGKAIEGYKDAIISLAHEVKTICDLTGVDFRAPSWIKSAMGIESKEEKKDEVKTTTESLTDTESQQVATTEE